MSDSGFTRPVWRCCRLSEDLEEVIRLAEQGPVTARLLLDHLAARGHALLALLLVLPFLQPVPLVGLSTPIGLALALLGAFMALGKPPWLPRRWLDRELSPQLVLRAVRIGQRLLARAERFIKPRGRWLHAHPWANTMAGVIIAISGFELALPLPIIFTNTMPALVIAVLSVGLLEQDGLWVALGGMLFLAVATVFLSLIVLPLVGLRLLL
ncbi:MAG: exopolysaccharide biosynthesis protein [Acidobacteriota bacterium]|jgi:hypothetical protein